MTDSSLVYPTDWHTFDAIEHVDVRQSGPRTYEVRNTEMHESFIIDHIEFGMLTSVPYAEFVIWLRKSRNG